MSLLGSSALRQLHQCVRSAATWRGVRPALSRPLPTDLHQPHAPQQRRFLRTTEFRLKKDKGKQKTNVNNTKSGKGKESTIDDLLDELSSDDEDDDVGGSRRDQAAVLGVADDHTPVGRFMHKAMQHSRHHDGSGTGKGKGKSAHGVAVNYAEALEIMDVDDYWEQMEGQIQSMKDFYAHNLTVRSATALDDLPVTLEGDIFPLREVSSISRKDPKRIIIDCSSFPQATQDIMKAIVNSNMNLNPQQEGTRIYVPIPKVTKEYRESLAKGAKSRLVETKESLRKAHHAAAAELEAGKGVSVDKIQAMKTLLQEILNHFNAEADHLCHAKQQDILKTGK